MVLGGSDSGMLPDVSRNPSAVDRASHGYNLPHILTVPQRQGKYGFLAENALPLHVTGRWLGQGRLPYTPARRAET